MSKSVFCKEEADKLAITYAPRKFPAMVTPAAKDFVAYQSQQESPSFRIDRIVAQQTGVAELERVSIEQQVEKEALARVKEIQEAAYREAYQLGLDEGREKAFAEAQEHLAERVEGLDQLMLSIENLKKDLIDFNETHILKLVFYMASRIAMDEIRERPEIVLNVIKKAIESAQSEENVTIRVSKQDLEFINTIRDRMGKDMDRVKRARMEESDAVSPGGCVVETNFGVVDASIEQRVQRLWTGIEEKLPKIRSVVGE